MQLLEKASLEKKFSELVTLVVHPFFAVTDILTTRGAWGAVRPLAGQTQWPHLGPFGPWSSPDVDD